MGLRWFRNLIFWALVILYVVLAPAITLYALGYVFEPQSLSFIKTGIISIKSDPQGANLSLNGAPYLERTPAAITRLLPGRYHVSVSAPGYLTWEQELDVLPEEVTRIEKIFLVPSEPVISNPVPFPVQAMLSSHESSFLFLIANSPDKISFYALDLNKQKILPLFHYKDPDGASVKAVQMFSSFDDRRALTAINSGNKVVYFTSLISEKPNSILLSDIVKTEMTNVRFHPRDSDKFYYLEENRLYILELKEKLSKVTPLRDVIYFETIHDKIYFVNSEGLLFFSDLEGKESKNLLPDKGLRRLLFGEKGNDISQMFLTEKENAFWLKDDGTLLMNRLPYFIDEDVKGARLAIDSEKLVYWKSRELWLVDLTTQEEESDSFFEHGPDKKLIWESKRPILWAQVIKGFGHILAATSEGIFFLDTQVSLPVVNSQFLISNFKSKPSLAFVYFDEDSGDLYWIDRGEDERNYLNQTQLTEPNLFPFSFRLRKSYSTPVQIEL